MILSTDRIKLRPWSAGDETSLIRYAGNHRIAVNMRDRFPYPYTETDARNWISIATQGTPLSHFAIEYEGEAIGGIGFVPGEDVFSRTAELGYWIGQPFWGKGIATEAIGVIAPYAFQSYSLTRLFAGVFSYNPASGRVLEKAGFTLESVQRKAVFKEHQVLDLHMYVMIR
jgi:RimJ/RimL family protein N-acetyltransferase